MRRSVVAVAAAALAGCSLIYNPNNLPDPRTIDAALIDADPCALTVLSVSPSVIDEGQGDHGSAPALVVLHGNNLLNRNLKVELKALGGVTVHLDPVTDAVASNNTTYVAFTVTSRVDFGLKTDVLLDIVVSQDAPADNPSCAHETTLQGQLTLRGLPELPALPANLGTLAPKYSQVMLPAVMLDGKHAMTGQVPLALRAVSSINIGAVAISGSAAGAGPGGYDGGAGAGGGVGGGGVGGSVSGLGLGGGGGGGGGGYAADGKAGGKGSGLNGGVAGAAGLQCGDDQLLAATNRASAGGAGGAGGLTAITQGGAGGGGGGTLQLSAGGDITINGITANGGMGIMPGGGGGSGGGGAGGTVLLHTSNGALSAGTIRVAGGPAVGNGGAGAPGRVRWDAPGDTAPSSPDSPPLRGPSFVAPSPVFTTASPKINLKGPASRGFIVRVIDEDNMPHDGGAQSFNAAGTTMIGAQLRPGRNQVCVILDGGPQTTVLDQCIDVAFLP